MPLALTTSAKVESKICAKNARKVFKLKIFKPVLKMSPTPKLLHQVKLKLTSLKYMVPSA
jgi:hypothetical protein